MSVCFLCFLLREASWPGGNCACVQGGSVAESSQYFVVQTISATATNGRLLPVYSSELDNYSWFLTGNKAPFVQKCKRF